MPDNFAGKADITRSVTIVGLVIVAISMVRLVNRITMGILERIRDIGMLRCVGARARHIRGIFRHEGLVIAVTEVADRSGRRLRARLRHQQAHELHRAPGADVHVLAVNLVITLIGTVILALLVLLAPLRRAVRFKPGEGLRYA